MKAEHHQGRYGRDPDLALGSETRFRHQPRDE
jgi:hypothetical protein